MKLNEHRTWWIMSGACFVAAVGAVIVSAPFGAESPVAVWSYFLFTLALAIWIVKKLCHASPGHVLWVWPVVSVGCGLPALMLIGGFFNLIAGKGCSRRVPRGGRLCPHCAGTGTYHDGGTCPECLGSRYVSW